MDRRPMTPSSKLVIGNRVHAHPLLSALHPEKLREQEVLGTRVRHPATRSATRGCHQLSPLGVFCDEVTHFGASWSETTHCASRRTKTMQKATREVSSERSATFSRCGIVGHRRCPNPRLPRSTPSAYSQRTKQGQELLSPALADPCDLPADRDGGRCRCGSS